jgi:TetR/AcrR family transcriptional regulator, transcriptional repressor for nem operon
MPRPRSFTGKSITQSALGTFWQAGYHATSMDDLVAATGASRHAIYTEFGGKHALFISALDAYRDEIVTPAFSMVEADGANLASVARYFEFQIARAEAIGLPGAGCFFANSSTEVAPHDDDVRARVDAHNRRLFNGFLAALRTTAGGRTSSPPSELANLAATMVVFATGLWTASRAVGDAKSLRQSVRTFLAMIERALR